MAAASWGGLDCADRDIFCGHNRHSSPISLYACPGYDAYRICYECALASQSRELGFNCGSSLEPYPNRSRDGKCLVPIRRSYHLVILVTFSGRRTLVSLNRSALLRSGY
jgi:hypothetical protein